jgi:hypothetical protein
MKKLILAGIALLVGLLSTSSGPASPKVLPGSELDVQKIEVLYFHYERRCMTCNNVEKISKNALTKFYPEKVKSGEISFRSANIEEKAGKDLATRWKVSGQTLLVTMGNKKVDLTSTAFMYANTNPEKIEAAIKAQIDKFLK